MSLIRPHMVLGFYGTSLTQGRLNVGWTALLTEQMKQYPECRGPVDTFNQGKGSQNSDWGLANINLIADMRPTHVLMEGFAINDAATAVGFAVPQARHITNVTAMVAAIRAARADVVIAIQTMNAVSAAGGPGRPNLAAYYADEVTLAGTLGLDLINNYAGTVTVPGGWPKPGPDALYQIDPTSGVPDGLHPVMVGGVDTYLLPNVAAWVHAKMAAFWP